MRGAWRRGVTRGGRAAQARAPEVSETSEAPRGETQPESSALGVCAVSLPCAVASPHGGWIWVHSGAQPTGVAVGVRGHVRGHVRGPGSGVRRRGLRRSRVVLHLSDSVICVFLKRETFLSRLASCVFFGGGVSCSRFAASRGTTTRFTLPCLHRFTHVPSVDPIRVGQNMRYIVPILRDETHIYGNT